MRVQYYLHDDYSRGELAEYFEEKGVPADIAAKAASERPFYEVTLECEIDEETGAVTLISATL